jgi:tetratricopeptide (TPR) repeat protein
MQLGRYESALAEAEQAHRLRGDVPIAVNLVARNYIFLDRLQDARTIFQKAFAQNPDQLFWRQGIYLLSFFDRDTKRMEDQVAWAMNTPGAEEHLLSMHYDTNAYFGRLGKARELTRQAVEFALRGEFRETAALLVAREALWEAWLGNSEAATRQARAALSLFAGRDVRALAALALARTGDAGQARKLADQLDAGFPLSTLVHYYWLPTIRAEIELHAGNHDRAIELLRTTAPYDLADTPLPLIPVYIRGQAFLLAGEGASAAGEFQKVLDHRGIVANSPLGSLGPLGLARAFALSGETAKARGEYQRFFEFWKQADTNIPIFKQAQAEYAKVN